MRSFYAFLKKERMELTRTGRLTILLIVYILFGIMNPAIAKLTPWLMKTMSESLEASGLTIAEVTVNALTSWEQFYKNIPLALIILVLILCGTFTTEYQKGTLIPILTRGLARHKILAAKGIVLLLLWTLCYWLCFGITFAYSAWFWDNSIASHLLFSGAAYWLFGIWVLSLLILCSTLAKNSTGVLLGTGGIVLVLYLLSLLPALKNYLPTKLMSAGALLSGSTATVDYQPAIWITLALTVLAGGVAVLIFERRIP